jgi:hypothetical protein
VASVESVVDAEVLVAGADEGVVVGFGDEVPKQMDRLSGPRRASLNRKSLSPTRVGAVSRRNN